MDLSRWSLRQFGNALGHALGTVLDSDLPSSPADEVRDQFEISESNEALEQELAFVRPGASPEKILNAFMPFFEGGLCLKTENQSTFMTAFFLFGQTFTPAESHGTPLEIGVADLAADRVYKMSLTPILRKLALGNFFRLDGATAFAFRLSSDTVFVLFDNRPHPWQVFALEQAFYAARETYQRVSAAANRNARGLFK